MLGVAGSQLYGTNLDDADNDLMGVCVEPPEYVIGLQKFEQYQHHSAGEGVRSTGADEDVTIYSLRKWTRLAADGNPTVLLLGFTPDHLLKHDTWMGRSLRANMHMFLSRQAASRFLGYLDSQRKQMLGLTGRKHSNRPELVEQHGFDTKFAYHAVRLGMQGVEYLKTGHMQLPMADEQREYLLDIRRGKVPREAVLHAINNYDRQLVELKESALLPDKPNMEQVDDWLAHIYTTYWQGRGLV